MTGVQTCALPIYLHHVVKAGEIIASMLLTWHNLTYYQDLMARLRLAIAAGTIQEEAREIASTYSRPTEKTA